MYKTTITFVFLLIFFHFCLSQHDHLEVDHYDDVVEDSDSPLVVNSSEIESSINDYPMGAYQGVSLRQWGEYLGRMMGCGNRGWCAFRCCPPVELYPSPYRSHYPARYSRTPISLYEKIPKYRLIPVEEVPARCARACMPSCNSKCILRYNKLVAAFMASLTAVDVMGPVDNLLGKPESPYPLIRPEHQEEDTLCRRECMPLCTEKCLAGRPRLALSPRMQVTDRTVRPHCKKMCMPTCTRDCVDSPPLMLPCMHARGCYCPAGYVQCSENTCCMKYKTMAVKYNNRLLSYSYSDEDAKKDEQPSDNQTAVYMKALRKMGGGGRNETQATGPSADSSVRQLPRNGTVVHYPALRKTEIMFDDGEIVVEHMPEE